MKGCKLCEILEHNQYYQKLTSEFELNQTNAIAAATAAAFILNGVHNHNHNNNSNNNNNICNNNNNNTIINTSNTMQSGFCSHKSGNDTSNQPTSAKSATLSSPFGMLSPYLKDMFFAAQLIRGYYQPAGPLISSHLVSQSQQQQQQQGTTKSILSPLDSDVVQLQQPPPSQGSAADNSDAEILITGSDLSARPQTFRYAPQPLPPQSITGPYSRPIHQMHCPTYPPATYYASYSSHPQDMCYSQPYQPPPYYPSKVYPAAYRRYITAGSYYQPSPSDMYDPPLQLAPPPPPPPPSLAPNSGPSSLSQSHHHQQQQHLQPPPQQQSTGSSQIVPVGGPSGPQHLDHYLPPPPPPPPYYTTAGYSPGGGQCYTRSMQPPYMDGPPYQSSCPCPMQSSCPKNVHTGPLIGSKASKGPVQQNSLMAAAAAAASAPHDSLTIPPINLASAKITCKTENGTDLSIVKPEIIDSSPPPPSSTLATAAPMQTTQSAFDINRKHQQQQHQHQLQHYHHHHHHQQQQHINDKEPYEKIVHAPPHPTFSINTRMMEPDTPISPARGSIGLSMVPIQDSATQPIVEMTPIVRRARVGKTMAREMVYQHLNNSINQQHQHHHRRNDPITDVVTSPVLINLSKKDQQTELMDIKPNVELIKKEFVKIEKEEEEEEEVVFVENVANDSLTKSFGDRMMMNNDGKENISSQSDQDNSYKRKASESNVINLDDTLDDIVPIIGSTGICTKRRKILELNRPNGNKKSPTNSYKSLIKQTEPKTYLNTNDTDTPRRSRFRVIRKNGTGSRFSSQPIFINRRNKKVLIPSGKKIKRRIRRRKIVRTGSTVRSKSIEKKSIVVREPEVAMSIASTSTTTTESSVVTTTATAAPAAVTSTTSISAVAITGATTTTAAAPSPKTLITTLFSAENSDISSNSSSSSSNNSTKFSTTSTLSTTLSTDMEEMAKPKNFVKTTAELALEINNDKTEEKTIFMTSLELTTEGEAAKQRLAKRSSSESKAAAAAAATAVAAKLLKRTSGKNSHAQIHQNNRQHKTKESIEWNQCRDRSKSTSSSTTTTTATDCSTKSNSNSSTKTTKQKGGRKGTSTAKTKKTKSKKVIDDMHLLDDTSFINNNHILLDNNNYHMGYTKPATGKKSKSRTKFSNKKRHRARQPLEVDEVIIPRKTNAPPRWSNGWSWVGDAFQGKVFLNSDDHLVIRTRYPAMKHKSGDVIRPGDCVLLKAGSKKNELPYVAKVASLWENPEDGEMMMSLLWYYRPEHTEQGRQPVDSIDEVFASRHLDHNSVACIEDKCYVLTYNEYCRYRKTIKAIEEGVEEPLPVALPDSSYVPREVPSNASPELVFFCRRVYEFRLRRITKNPT